MKRNNLVVKVLAIMACAASAGCAHMGPPPPRPEIVSASVVIDMVKDELRAYLASNPAVPNKVGACFTPDASHVMNLAPRKVTVTLKAVASRENDPSAGLAAPFGILSIDPSYSGAYSQAQTQTFVIPLVIPEPPKKMEALAPGKRPLADALAKFRDEIVQVDHSKTPCLQFTNDDKNNFKVSLAFDVVNKTTTGLGLQLAVFKLGDKEVFGNEAHQTLDIEMALTGSGAMLMVPVQ